MKRLLLGIASLLIIGVSVAYYLDARIPRATAILQVHPSIIGGSPSGMMTQMYMESEFETIVSDQTLSKAAASLDLDPDETLILKDKVTTEPMRGSDFIKIIVKEKDPDQAIKIANAIAEAYVERRTRSEKLRAKKALEALDNELTAQEKLVHEHLEEFRNTADKNNILVTTNSMGSTTFKLQAQESNDPIAASLRMSDVTQAKEAYEQSRAMLREMKIKQQEARVLLKMPRMPVTIHERAKISQN